MTFTRQGLEDQVRLAQGVIDRRIRVVEDDGMLAMRTYPGEPDGFQVRLQHRLARRRCWRMFVPADRANGAEGIAAELDRGAAAILALPDYQMYVEAFPVDPDDEGGEWMVSVAVDHAPTGHEVSFTTQGSKAAMKELARFGVSMEAAIAQLQARTGRR